MNEESPDLSLGVSIDDFMLTYPSIGDAPLNTLIHPTAVVHSKAELHPTVQVGSYAVIGEKVTIALFGKKIYYAAIYWEN